jgi:polyribonucleotide nucleotidyltransferase
MIEAGAKEVSEEEILGGIKFAQSEAKKVQELINDLVKEVGREKEPVVKKEAKPDLEKKVKAVAHDKVVELIEKSASHTEGLSEFDDLKRAVVADFAGEDAKYISQILDDIFKNEVRSKVLSGTRPDGRKLDEIRKLSIEVGILPRTHGSAIFQRGITQVLTVTTLGAPSMEQLIESAEGEESKRYIHHYSMPPYATGETGRIGSPNRREIGHGALAERALEPVIPTEEKFPYTIRVVSEVTSSNGSTSMASVCGSTLSLMDAGVPVTSPVSGIAMGLVVDGKKIAIMSDIAGIEDFNGDMDFKVAGTEKGITSLQMDVKTLSLTPEILESALKQAKEGRAFILKTMLAALPTPREKVSAYAPKIKVVKVPVEKIGEVIGPGGKMIKKIIAESGAEVDVEDDGSVNISATNDEALAKAVSMVEALIKEVVAGEIYEGEVKRIQPFGAFVEILPGKDGLVHVSDMSEGFVADPNEIVKIGEKVKVRVREIDAMGRINLSMNMDPSKDKPREERPARSFGPRRGFSPRGRSGFNRGPRRDFSPRERGQGGPHFPTSRFLGEKKDFTR